MLRRINKVLLGCLFASILITAKAQTSVVSSSPTTDWGVVAHENPDNAYLQFQAGLKNYFSLTENSFALDYFRKASLNMSNSEFETTESKGKAPYDTYYFMAETFRRLEEPDSVMKYLLLYQEHVSVSHYNINLAMSKAYNASLTYRQKGYISNHPFTLNENYLHPNNPIISVNGARLFFTTEKVLQSEEIEHTGYEDRDIVFCSKDNGNWVNAEVFTYNTEADEYPVYTSPLGDDLYFVRKDKKSAYHLYKSQLRQGKWSEPVLMGKPFNSAFGVRGFALNVNQDKALFSKEVEGQFVLYYTFLENEKWKIPKKLAIPNVGDVLSPVFHFSDTVIYFTSNGINHQGLGGFDIYAANLSSDAKVSNIHALSYPINKTFDTEFFSIAGTGVSFVSSYHEHLGSEILISDAFSDVQMADEQLASLAKGGDVITNTEVAEVLVVDKEVIKEVEKEVIQEVVEIEEVEVDKEVSLGYVTNKDAKKLDNIVRVETDTVVEYLDAEPVEEIAVVDNETAEEVVNQDQIDADSVIAHLEITQLDSTLRSNLIAHVNAYEKKEKRKALEKKSKEEGVATTEIKYEGPNLEAENIYFDFNSTTISKEGKLKLDEVVKMLLSDEKITAELVGYTDNKGDFKVNRQIALARADKVYYYLLNKGVSEKKMISYGRAFLQQAGKNDTESGRKLNRRVEILLYR